MCKTLVIGLWIKVHLQVVCWYINCMILKILKSELEWQVVNNSGQQNYMGEVPRLPIASPGPRLMEMFFLVLSTLMGIDTPYLLINIIIIIILFFIIIH